MEQLRNKITATEGKVFRRISDQMIFGKEIYLGKTYYLGGRKLDEPLDELPEHFEEIDEPLDDREQPAEVSADDTVTEIPVGSVEKAEE